MGKVETGKIAPLILEAITVAGHLEQEAFDEANGVLLRKSAKQEESGLQPLAPVPLSQQIQIDTKSSPFDAVLAKEFMQSGYLDWGHSPEELIKWVTDYLSAGEKSISEMCLALQQNQPITPQPVYYSQFCDAINSLTKAGILHTSLRQDPMDRDLYPTETYFVNIGRDAQNFVLNTIKNSERPDVNEAKVDTEALLELENLLTRNKVQFGSESGLKGFLAQFVTSGNEPRGSGSFLLALNDFSFSTRALIEGALMYATNAGVLNVDENGLFTLNNSGRKLLLES